MNSQYARLIVCGAMLCGGLAMTLMPVKPARAADFCSEIKLIAAAVPSGFKEYRGAQTQQDDKVRTYQATGWPQGALACRITENVNLTPKGLLHYVCEFPLTMTDKGKAATLFAAQLAKCLGGSSRPMPYFKKMDQNGGAISVDAKGFYGYIGTSQKSSSIAMSVSKP